MTTKILRYAPSRTHTEVKDCAAHEEAVTNVDLENTNKTFKQIMNT